MKIDCGLRCHVLSDGTLRITSGRRRIWLTPGQTVALRRFMVVKNIGWDGNLLLKPTPPAQQRGEGE